MKSEKLKVKSIIESPFKNKSLTFALRVVKLTIFHFSLFTFNLTAQDVFLTTNGHISFFSDGVIENITAVNDQVTGYINIENGTIAFVLLVKAFRFEKALMQEHFNENYMESHIHPKAKFSGSVTNFLAIDFKKAGRYPATVNGELTIHGITRNITVEGILEVAAGGITGSCKFPIRVADYEIKIPRIMMQNIAEVVEVTLQMDFKPKAN